MNRNMRRLAGAVLAAAMVTGCGATRMGSVDPALRVDWGVYQALYGNARDMEQLHPEVRAAVLRECGGRDGSGVTYEGATRNGLAHGRGAMALTFGCDTAMHYEGEFREGKPHGHGVMTFPDGRRYEGEFRYGKAVR